jgi:hypothetical protein
LRTGRADVVTGEIAGVDGTGVDLEYGENLLGVNISSRIVTASGVSIIRPRPYLVWRRSSWLQDVPNLAFAFTYANAS